MLRVQEYLLTHSLVELHTAHAVKARADTRNGHKVSLNYDQIEVRDSDLVAQECRGLVLSTPDGRPFPMSGVVGETCVLARAFDRFFNLGTTCAADVPLVDPKTRIFEKLDGTLCIVYFDPFCDQWQVATRAVCEADLPVDGWGKYTFRTLFEHALHETTGRSFDAWTPGLSKVHTYLFELCTPVNQVVVKHDAHRIALLGVRNTLTGLEVWPEDIGPSIAVPPCPYHALGTPEQVLEFVRSRDPQRFEGVVACYEVSPGVFHRVKIKNAQYLAYSRLKDAVSSPRNVMTLILGENLDDAMNVMPDDVKTQALQMQDGMRALFSGFDVEYAKLYAAVSQAAPHEHGSKEHRKAFAIAARDSPLWFEPAMAKYAGKAADAREFINLKREDNGEWPSGFLDYLIEKALEAAKGART